MSMRYAKARGQICPTTNNTRGLLDPCCVRRGDVQAVVEVLEPMSIINRPPPAMSSRHARITVVGALGSRPQGTGAMHSTSISCQVHPLRCSRSKRAST